MSSRHRSCRGTSFVSGGHRGWHTAVAPWPALLGGDPSHPADHGQSRPGGRVAERSGDGCQDSGGACGCSGGSKRNQWSWGHPGAQTPDLRHLNCASASWSQTPIYVGHLIIGSLLLLHHYDWQRCQYGRWNCNPCQMLERPFVAFIFFPLSAAISSSIRGHIPLNVTFPVRDLSFATSRMLDTFSTIFVSGYFVTVSFVPTCIIISPYAFCFTFLSIAKISLVWHHLSSIRIDGARRSGRRLELSSHPGWVMDYHC